MNCQEAENAELKSQRRPTPINSILEQIKREVKVPRLPNTWGGTPSSNCCLERTQNATFGTLERTRNLMLMDLERSNEEIMTYNGQKLRNGTSSGQQCLETRPMLDKNLEKWDLKVSDPPPVAL